MVYLKLSTTGVGDVQRWALGTWGRASTESEFLVSSSFTLLSCSQSNVVIIIWLLKWYKERVVPPWASQPCHDFQYIEINILDFDTGYGSLVNVPTPEISTHFWYADNLCFWASKTMGQASRWFQDAFTNNSILGVLLRGCWPPSHSSPTTL